MSKHTIHVCISGCDDQTDFDIEVTSEQYKGLRALAALSLRNSEYGCQPTITLHHTNQGAS